MGICLGRSGLYARLHRRRQVWSRYLWRHGRSPHSQEVKRWYNDFIVSVLHHCFPLPTHASPHLSHCAAFHAVDHVLIQVCHGTPKKHHTKIRPFLLHLLPLPPCAPTHHDFDTPACHQLQPKPMFPHHNWGSSHRKTPIIWFMHRGSVRDRRYRSCSTPFLLLSITDPIFN